MSPVDVLIFFSGKVAQPSLKVLPRFDFFSIEIFLLTAFQIPEKWTNRRLKWSKWNLKLKRKGKACPPESPPQPEARLPGIVGFCEVLITPAL